MSIVTTSAGRFFDAVAALVLGIEHAGFEGHPAMLLEAACDPASEGSYPVHIYGDEPYQVDWRPLMKMLLDDLLKAVSPGTIAMRFHRSLAVAIGSICEHFPDLPVVLCGGVFQNRVLVELLEAELHGRGHPVGFPGTIPPNDGGLSAGQLAIALARLSLCSPGRAR
jgi:hydrogenase maturation protein HypF